MEHGVFSGNAAEAKVTCKCGAQFRSAGGTPNQRESWVRRQLRTHREYEMKAALKAARKAAK